MERASVCCFAETILNGSLFFSKDKKEAAEGKFTEN